MHGLSILLVALMGGTFIVSAALVPFSSKRGSGWLRWVKPTLMLKCLVLIAIVLLSGCQYDPYAYEYTSRQPNQESVIGRYVPDDESKQRLRTRFGIELSPDCEFVLNDNQTFVARSLPHCWYQTFECGPGPESWSGTWAVEKDQEWWAVGLHVNSRNGVPTGYYMSATLRREAPPYLLHLTIGDPDSGDALAFQYASPPTKTDVKR